MKKHGFGLIGCGAIAKLHAKAILDIENAELVAVYDYNYEFGKNCGVHIEPGPDGGIVVLDDTTIYDMALEILKAQGQD